MVDDMFSQYEQKTSHSEVIKRDHDLFVVLSGSPYITTIDGRDRFAALRLGTR